MRLTSDLILQSRAFLNCLGDRTLLLRNLSIPAIENLAVARDSFDTIDLSCNLISTLGDGFPPFPRLTSLFLPANRITAITSGLADSLPNLSTLILTANRIETLQDLNLTELSKLTKLQVLSIAGNPVADLPGAKDAIITALPSLKVLDFAKVSRRTARAGLAEKSRKRKRRVAHKEGTQPAKRRAVLSTYEFHTGNAVEATPPENENSRVQITADMSAKLQKLIADAGSVAEITRIQAAVRNGKVNELLQTIATGSDGPSKNGGCL